uniref:Hemopexin n=1 Tax=Chanos chanos TaxID=29144 RepID=A0A1V0E497_CHACN|nr:65 kDa warm temperature acclimation protein 2 [Chanos chanos]
MDRCEGIEFDAIAPDEHGVTFFFKGDHMWTGFHGDATLLNSLYKELDEHHHLGHVDAAFRMHHPADPSDHDHIFFFLDDKVFSYYQHKLEAGYPKPISEVFPGIPSHLDAAVECPKGECVADSVLFFKGSEIFHFDTRTKNVKMRPWTHLPNCTSALRWLEHYYCFHGHNFTRFHPVTGSVVGSYPKDARNYFMRCPKFGHGSDDTERERCSHVHLDAITSDDLGRSYAFRGNFYLRLSDRQEEGWHAFPISNTWKEIGGDVDAVFSYDSKLYIIKGEQVYIYKSGAGYTLIEGYPKSLKDELGIEGPVDAAFVCGDYEILHVIKGQSMYEIDLNATPRGVRKEAPLFFPKVDAASCGPDGVKVFVGPKYFHYESPMLFSASRIQPHPHKISLELLGCDH